MFLRIKTKLIFLEERNNDVLQIIAIRYLIAVTILMIRPCIFLKIHISATKEIFQLIQDIFIFFDEFNIKPWFGFHPSFNFFIILRILYVNCEASFTVYQPDNIIIREIPSHNINYGYYESADF